ncbi:MAG: hypothetical protein GX493_03900 [Firmicutes bacterium]|nr:hypothetical protein [Bacillota bacterium]
MGLRDLKWLTPEVERIQAAHRERVAALYRGEPLEDVIAIAGPLFGTNHGLAGTNQIDMLKDPDAWLDEVLSDMAARIEVAADPITFQPLAIEIDPLGTHFIDALFGAEVGFHEGQVWSFPLRCDLSELSMPDLANSELLRATLRLVRAAVSASQGRILIAAPVLSCPINIGINLFGERLLEGLIEQPEETRRALRIITDVIIALTRIFIAEIPDEIRRTSVASSRYAPPGYGLIDGCATQLVSREHYREFFAPLDAEILAVYPEHRGMIHLCGAHSQHILLWREMEGLSSIQLNDRAAEDLELYVKARRPDQIIYITPTPTMTVDRIMEITKGERVILQCQLTERIPLK